MGIVAYPPSTLGKIENEGFELLMLAHTTRGQLYDIVTSKFKVLSAATVFSRMFVPVRLLHRSMNGKCYRRKAGLRSISLVSSDTSR